MYAQEQCVEEPSTVEALVFIVQLYLRIYGFARTGHYLAALQQDVSPIKQLYLVTHHATPPLALSSQQPPQQHLA